MLDQDQAQVVAHNTGPAAVLAGAGSGKTRCTTERAVRRLTQAGVPSEGLILLTFTNKAAAEMRERLGQRLPSGFKLPWIGTFHSFGNRLLRMHGKHIGIPRNATLMDADDAARMLDAFLAAGFPDKGRRLDAMRMYETLCAHGLDITEEAERPAIERLCDDKGFPGGAKTGLLTALARYEAEKRRAAVLDFSDLILLPARLLRCQPDLQQRLRAQLKDVTVDEAQDTDGAQFRLLKLITPEDNTVLLVGDDDQAIYEWRHARPENMRDFIDEYGAVIYRLERNYRSTPAIVNGGTALVRHNENRLEKNPYPVRGAPASDLVQLLEYEDAEAMAEGVADRIATATSLGTSPADIAVLYRKNRLSRTVETALLRRGIPYRIKAGTDLLSYADVRMMLAAGRLAANRRDIRALSRLADLVPGLGAKGVAQMIGAGDQPLLQLGRLSPKAAKGVRELSTVLDQLYQQGPGSLLEWCRDTPLFRAWLNQRAAAQLKAAGQSMGGVELQQALRPAQGRMRAVQMAMSKRMDSSRDQPGLEARWAAALEVVAAGTDEAESDQPKVTLCTIHASKGLEWPQVHLFGFSEGLMPMERDQVVENLAEERRLAYVALTRAQDNITLHHADRVDLAVGKGAERLAVSRFVAEISAGHQIQVLDRRSGAAPQAEEKKSGRDWLAQMRKAVSQEASE
ncbi:ATP-dependent helicase [Alkalilimnicola sp. S0819]|uniref:ATP-dependent helicase n=1 Tax=Alkalilimnicola sp. S0819 TaxID=2613922 RepID=UPI001869B0C9|nr:ATP-dependent helicase [Alkalilimnicola sp. S0819]